MRVRNGDNGPFPPGKYEAVASAECPDELVVTSYSTCPVCGDEFVPRRKEQWSCGRSACRARRWREIHLPRCPHCGGPIEVSVTAPQKRSEREETA